jgi:nucleotide-binding universal stress UspA family protein
MYKHIMVPLDGSELAECVLDHVVAIVKGCTVPRVTLVRVVPPLKLYGADIDIPIQGIEAMERSSMASAKEYLQKQAEMLMTKGIQVETEVQFGIVVDTLLEFAEKNAVDLIVIATHGRSGISRWVLGSVADRLLRSANAPVLMVRPTEVTSKG